MQYPISLAIEDFVPVLCTTAAILVLRKVIRDRAGVLLAALLVGAGGLAKATAKLVQAAGGPDLQWLRGLLFPLLGIGFGLLCLELARARGAGTPRWLALLVTGLLCACALVAVVLRSPMPMLVCATVFATISGIYLIEVARARGDTLTAALFGIQLLVFFILGPLGSRSDQTVALQWAEQLCNTAAQAAFLVAALRLSPNAFPASDEHKEMVR